MRWPRSDGRVTVGEGADETFAFSEAKYEKRRLASSAQPGVVARNV
jgi:hypothetical protein